MTNEDNMDLFTQNEEPISWRRPRIYRASIVINRVYETSRQMHLHAVIPVICKPKLAWLVY